MIDAGGDDDTARVDAGAVVPAATPALSTVPAQAPNSNAEQTEKIAARARGLVDIRDVDVQPKVLDRRLPDYTHRAMRLKQQGTVEL